MLDAPFCALLCCLLGLAYSRFDPGCGCCCQCAYCPDRPHQIQLIIAGVVANTCADCPDVNGTWLLDDCCRSVYIDPDDTAAGQLNPLPDRSCCSFADGSPCYWSVDGPKLCGDATQMEFERACQAGTNAYTLRAMLRKVETCGLIAAWSKTGANNTCDAACTWSSVALTQNAIVGPCTQTASTCALTSL